MKPGIHTMSADAYHADPCERPSLSASMAHILCTSSPAHARQAHPKLNPTFERHDEEKFDVGTVAHALLLQGEDIAVVVDAPDWRTNAAKEERDVARAAGQIPLLAKHWEAVQAMVAAAREQLATHAAAPPLFTDGLPEQTLVWEEPNGITCRSRLDWLRDDHATIDDLKTTGRSANPDAYSRALFGVGGDVQAAFYLRGLKALTGADGEFRWVVVETSPPYALAVIAPGPDVLALAEEKVESAIERWRLCLETGDWPAYSRQVCFAELPPWEEMRWMEREAREAA